jgi:Fur family ferric uptake transcriptional regulator
MDKETLKSLNLKYTKKREAIVKILEQANEPMTAEDIYTLTSNDLHMSFSTVYRSLSALTDKNLIMKELRQDGKTYYQINSLNHKHHLICTICGEVTQIDQCPLHELEHKLTMQTGYVITGHNLEFCGICPKCANHKKN